MTTNRAAVCLFCGSSPGTLADTIEGVRAFAAALAGHGIALVYGGGNTGLMGAAADAALAAGGSVIGVIPEHLVARERAHQGLDELLVVGSMHERKALMAQRSHAFVAAPGGIGTLEELFEVLTWQYLDLHAKPVALLNLDGFYDPMLDFLRNCVERGFLAAATLARLVVHTEPQALADWLAAELADAPPATQSTDLL
ncbi:TIGR00730 family Rossman fold protein [Derxia gummosa]|uniref:Cytokinin riboside 5'-monophosphate phosphoribohydrolase n=1 Tax=Derxia gummosa DSM 723 TaxID=1121388 RepID=A0A8B6X7H5_9BURK|nr:TIGR00730 family Rossman fold protein [Derxia gummosa]